MKPLLLILLLHGGVMAQDTTQRKYLLGIYAESNGGYWQRLNSQALTYKHVRSKLLSYTAHVGFGSFIQAVYSYPPYYGFADTEVQRRTTVYSKVLTAGVGVEVQRQFYKRLHLVAGGEIRAACGNAEIDTLVYTQYKKNSAWGPYIVTQTDVETRQGPPATMFHAGIAPYIGLKIEFRKFSIGTLSMNYFRQQNLRPATGRADRYTNLAIGETFYRLFVMYKI